jgi:hypothetical protein
MFKNLLLATGWFSAPTAHANPNRSQQCLDPYWLNHYWLPPLEKWLKPAHYFIYVSNCPTPPVLPLKYFQPISQTIVTGYLDAQQLPHQHDFHATLIMAAQYALMNHFDLLFVEQDCLVWGVEKLIPYLQTCPISYGFGEGISFMPGWAEQSLIWIRHDFLREFIYRTSSPEILDGLNTNEYPEPLFHRTFEDVFKPLPCGVGRRRPIPWEDDIFYFQQPRNSEIEKFQIVAQLKQEPQEI